MADEPIVLKYKPKHPGEGFRDVPRRDLTQTDVDALVGSALRDVLHPDGDPIYIPVADDKPPKPKAPPKPKSVKTKAEKPVVTADRGKPDFDLKHAGLDADQTDDAPKGGE